MNWKSVIKSHPMLNQICKHNFLKLSVAYYGDDKNEYLEDRKRIRRSFLYVPGHDLKKIKKLVQLQADCIVLDCEDGVAVDK